MSRDDWGTLSIKLDLVEGKGQCLEMQLVFVDDGLNRTVGPLQMVGCWREGRGRCGEGGIYGGEDVGEIPDDLGGRGEV